MAALATPVEIKPARAYRGQDGEIRHVVIVSKCGLGHRVLWDSVSSRHPEYYGYLFAAMKNRPHGLLPMRKFRAWAVEEVKEAA